MFEDSNGLVFGYFPSFLDLISELPAFAVLESDDEVVLVLVDVETLNYMFAFELSHNLDLGFHEFSSDLPDFWVLYLLDFSLANNFQRDN